MMGKRLFMNFTQSELPCYENGKAFDADGYRVVFYEYLSRGSITEKKDHWKAYYKDHYLNREPNEFKTKEEAVAACEKYANSLSDHRRASPLGATHSDLR
jgi:hypothetical protein